MNVSFPLRVCSRCCRKLLICTAGYHSSFHEHRLLEVGKMEPRQDTGCYQFGQLFMHGVFSYRGVLLYPWRMKVYDRDKYKNCEEDDGDGRRSIEDVDYDQIKSMTPVMKPYYISLIDKRDIPYLRTFPEAVTLLPDRESNNSLCTLPGLDYVSHDDVLPYTSTSSEPFFAHEIFGKFLASTGEIQGPPLFIARDVVKSWEETSHKWLNLSQVHCETTSGVKVTVIPFYLGYKETDKGKTFIWRYTIRIESTIKEQFQLKERHWKICSDSGELHTVTGTGVVGKEPIFNCAQPAFQYSSYVSIRYPSGYMWGTFRMYKGDGSSFDVRVPPFCLESCKTAIIFSTVESI